jgi:hypothetical protein
VTRGVYTSRRSLRPRDTAHPPALACGRRDAESGKAQELARKPDQLRGPVSVAVTSRKWQGLLQVEEIELSAAQTSMN